MFSCEFSETLKSIYFEEQLLLRKQQKWTKLRFVFAKIDKNIINRQKNNRAYVLNVTYLKWRNH